MEVLELQAYFLIQQEDQQQSLKEPKQEQQSPAEMIPVLKRHGPKNARR